MSDGRCPNCKKPLFLETSSTPTSDPSREDDPNEVSIRVTLYETGSKGESSQEVEKSHDKTKTPERKIGSVPRKKLKRRKRKKLTILVGCLLVIAVLVSVFAYRFGKITTVLNARRPFSQGLSDYSHAYSVEDWDSVIEAYEKMLDNLQFREGRYHSAMAERFARQDAEVLAMGAFTAAEAYFHKQRYNDAYEAQRRAVEFAESHPPERDLKWLQYAHISLAKYASFAYAKTGEVRYEQEVQYQIRKAHAMLLQHTNDDLPMKSDSVAGRIRRFGAMKYRLDTRKTISDEEWGKKFNVPISTPYARYVTIWLAKVAPTGCYRPVSAEDNWWYMYAVGHPSEIWITTEQGFERAMKKIEQGEQ